MLMASGSSSSLILASDKYWLLDGLPAFLENIKLFKELNDTVFLCLLTG